MNTVPRKVRLLLLVLPVALALLSSCASSPESAPSPKFFESAAADLVIRYSSDQAIFRLKPDGHDGTFYHIYSRKQLCDEDAARAGQRNLAVVLIGYQWTPQLDEQLRQSWVDSLSKLNYRRVVILRSGDSDQVDGLRVLDDRRVTPVAGSFDR